MRQVNAAVIAERADSYIKFLPALPENITVRAFPTQDAALVHAPETDVLVCWGLDWHGDFVARASRLGWLHTMSAGVEGVLRPELPEHVVLTNARGCNAPPIAETAMTMVLALARNLHFHIRMQDKHSWERNARRPFEINGKTLGLLGMGAIAQEVAWRAKGLGMRVIATRRRLGPQPLPEHIDAITDLPGLLAESDFLVVAAPLTPGTRGLLGADALALMKPGAYLINVSRGQIVDEPALVAALQSGKLAGAGLDVFATEPLPADSPLWDLPEVLITPHQAAASANTMKRIMSLLGENLQRFARGEGLLNLVDKRLGY